MMDSERAFSENVRSRLWQDPFQAVGDYRRQHSSSPQAPSGNKFFPDEIVWADDRNQEGKIVIKQPKGENRENRNLIVPSSHTNGYYAYEHDGKEGRLVCFNKTINSVDDLHQNYSQYMNSPDELKCQIHNAVSKPENLHTLAVMVPGGPYAEDKEWRLRTRYAVISALTELGYAPHDSEHIDYVDFSRICQASLRELRAMNDEPQDEEEKKYRSKKADLEAKTFFCHMGSFMPYEWFTKGYGENKKAVFLLWLNSSEFVSAEHTRPVKMLGFLKNRIFDSNEASRFDIIGPFGSG